MSHPYLADTPFATVDAQLAEILDFGDTPVGHRRVIHITGGTVEGPGLKGQILPGGADWQIGRADGVADIHARYTIAVEGGGHILAESKGLRHGPPEVIAALARGEDVDPASYFFRVLYRFETGVASLDWLNRTMAIGVGRRLPRGVKIDLYEVL